MKRSVIFLVICGFLALFVSNVAAQKFPSNKELAEKMATIDGGRFRAEQFESILNVIQGYYPEETYFDICFYITEFHAKAKEKLPDLSLYRFMLGFKNYVRDSNTNAKIGEALVVYTANKMSGY